MLMTTQTIQFLHERFTPIVGVPTAGNIRILTTEVYTNARAIYSVVGDGMNGHLGFVMPPADYLVRTGVAFILHVHPGKQANPPVAATDMAVVAHNLIEFTTNLSQHTPHIPTCANKSDINFSRPSITSTWPFSRMWDLLAGHLLVLLVHWFTCFLEEVGELPLGQRVAAWWVLGYIR
jgi:hypothetical protein